MADKDAATPRVFLIRHGETEWSRNGRYTGTTDLPLLPSGEQKILQTARVVIGPGKLIDPIRLLKAYVSPRQRARKTLELLLGSETAVPEQEGAQIVAGVDTVVTEDVREWTYGDYEGLKTHEILELRRERGLDGDGRKWGVWTHGAEGEGAEMPSDVAERVDRVIGMITGVHGEYLRKLKDGSGLGEFHGKRDVLIVAHGHILRAFVKRWLGLPLESNVELMLEPGGVCGLSYAHGKVDERAVLVGMSFPDGS